MPVERSLFTLAQRHMATDFEFALVVEPSAVRVAESVLREAHARVAEIEAGLTEYRTDSPVYRLNHSAAEEWVPLGADLRAILRLARDFHVRTAGAFSPFARSPYAATFADLEIDEPPRSRVRRRRSDLQLGFGAVGKGYALDEVAALLDRQGFADYRLGAGGSSWVFRGFGVDAAPWEISWAWARDADGDWVGQHYRLPGGKPYAIGISGTAEKGQHFLWNGAPLVTTIQSAFCGARSAAATDALSTALLVGATRAGEEFLTTFPAGGIDELSLAYVDLESQMIYNQAFDTLFRREGRIR